MCQIYIGYINQIDNFTMVYSVPNEGANAVLSPSYCGLYQQSAFWVRTAYWRELIGTPFIFQNTAQLSSSSNGLRVNDDVPELCRLALNKKTRSFANELQWNVELPFFTLCTTIVGCLFILFSFKLTEFALSRIQPGCYAKFIGSVQDRRKVVIYIFSPAFFSVLLLLLLKTLCWDAPATMIGSECGLIYNEFSEEHSVHIPWSITTVSNLSVIFYVMELAYRTSVCCRVFLYHTTFA